MLSSPAPDMPRPRSPLSLKQEYADFIQQRIEDFKNQMSREDLMALADDAVRELEMGPEGQLVLTEVLVCEHVDNLIQRRLKLPAYRRWRERYLGLRRAQREPTHWGLEADTPIRDLARRLETDDTAVVVGASAEGAALLLAAHDVSVILMDDDLTAVEALETRAAAEALSQHVQAMVVHLGHWFPDVTPAVTLIDAGTAGRLGPGDRAALIDTLRASTVSGGVHLVIAAHSSRKTTSLRPEAFRAHYNGWKVERPNGAPWIMAVCP